MAIIFDLDGTLSIVGERIKYLKQKKKDWDAFYQSSFDDEPNYPIVEIYKTFHHRYGYAEMYICTSRRECVRDVTLKWLKRHRIPILPNNLYMRSDNDKRSDVVVKPLLINHLKHDIKVIFEDRACMVNKWRELGYCCCQVAEGNF